MAWNNWKSKLLCLIELLGVHVLFLWLITWHQWWPGPWISANSNCHHLRDHLHWLLCLSLNSQCPFLNLQTHHYCCFYWTPYPPQATILLLCIFSNINIVCSSSSRRISVILEVLVVMDTFYNPHNRSKSAEGMVGVSWMKSKRVLAINSGF